MGDIAGGGDANAPSTQEDQVIDQARPRPAFTMLAKKQQLKGEVGGAAPAMAGNSDSDGDEGEETGQSERER